jgi:hypothetical protein
MSVERDMHLYDVLIRACPDAKVFMGENDVLFLETKHKPPDFRSAGIIWERIEN